MMRLNLVLLIAVLASALYLVRTQYESRRLFNEVDKAMGEARKLQIENERLQVEKRGQATPLRVERLAKEQLQMRTATPAITQYVPLGGSSTAAASAASVGAHMTTAGPPQGGRAGGRAPSGGSAAASAASVGAQ
jgi:cell division protein FtsL